MLTHTGDDKALFGVACSSYNISHNKRRGRSLIYGNNNGYGANNSIAEINFITQPLIDYSRFYSLDMSIKFKCSFPHIRMDAVYFYVYHVYV